MNVFEFPLFQQVALFYLIDLLRTGRFFFHLACHQVALIYHELDSELVGLIGKTLVVEQLLLLVVKQLSNPIPLSNRDVMRSLVEVEVTCILLRIRLLQFSV